MKVELRKAITKEKNNLKNGVLNDLFIGMANKPLLIYLSDFCLKGPQVEIISSNARAK